MPQSKQPQTLRNMAMRKLRAVVREVVPSWIGRLFLSAYRDIQYCQQQAQKMTNEGNRSEQFLSSLPTYTLNDLSPRVTRKLPDDADRCYEG